MEDEMLLEDELKTVEYSRTDDKILRIRTNIPFKIQCGIYVMRVPGALLYIINKNVTKVRI